MINKIKIQKELASEQWAKVVFSDGDFSIEKRPPYCDRGNFIVKIFVNSNQVRLYIDQSDMFPRYYFGFDNMISELEQWLEKNNQRIKE